MKPKRIQLSRTKGWRMPDNTIKVDRTTSFGNPYRVGLTVDPVMLRQWDWRFSPEGKDIVCGDNTEAAARFHHCLLWDGASHDLVRRHLGGKNLACWCPLDQACHADALLWLANSTPAQVNAIHAAADAQIMSYAAYLKAVRPDAARSDKTPHKEPE